MKDYMTLPEYVIAPELGISLDVAEKIRKYHAHPMNILRNKLGFPIIVSAKSGYRHEDYEKSKGRSGSTHEFRKISERQDPGFGAADYRVADQNFFKFITNLVQEDIYTRLIFYPESRTPFVHCDYRYFGIDKYYYLMSSSGIKRVSKNEIIESVWNRFLQKKGEVYA